MAVKKLEVRCLVCSGAGRSWNGECLVCSGAGMVPLGLYFHYCKSVEHLAEGLIVLTEFLEDRFLDTQGDEHGRADEGSRKP